MIANLSVMDGTVLSVRALNRATLARQHLLHRVSMPAIDMVEHLGGLQAQVPLAPHVALWTRLRAFDHGELDALLTERQVVRTSLWRGTIHLVSARDCRAFAMLTEPALARVFAGSVLRRDLAGVDLAELVAESTVLLGEAARTNAELGALLAQRWPDHDPERLGFAARFLVPMVQVPPRGVWRAGGGVNWTTTEAWLGQPLDPDPAPDAMVLRYLAAFGPASVRDVTAWSGLTRIREVVERLRSGTPGLRASRDEQGTELVDLPDAPRPDPDTPAPVRFLPEYDNVLLSHARRTRVMDEDRRPPLPGGNGANTGTVLVDGFFRATWRITRTRGTAALRVEAFDRLTAAERDEVTEEGAALLGFAAADHGGHEVDVVSR